MRPSWPDLPDRSPAATAQASEDGSVAVTIVEAVSDARGTSALALQPLGTAIDSDALESIVGSADGLTLAFRYAECLIVVLPDETIEIYC